MNSPPRTCFNTWGRGSPQLAQGALCLADEGEGVAVYVAEVEGEVRFAHGCLNFLPGAYSSGCLWLLFCLGLLFCC